MADLKSWEVQLCRECFEVFDTDGTQRIDAFYLGHLLRALDLVPTEDVVEKQGGTKKKGEKMISFEDFLPIFSHCQKNKDQGAFEDFQEGLKVYDKAENGTMMAAEMNHVLLSLGEKLTDGEVEQIFQACAPPEDEDGFMKYDIFVKNIMTGPFPEEAEIAK